MSKATFLDHGARLIMLRAAVGLDSPTDEDPPGLLAEWLAPGIKDLLFVSLDIEGKGDSSDSQSGLGYIFHCGISVLDTRALCDYARAISLARADAATPRPLAPELDSYHFSVGDNTNETNRLYLDGRRLRFRFHAEHHQMTSSAIARIHEILGHRPFILVTHGGNTDYRFWKTFHIGREPLWTIDTGFIVRHCYPRFFSGSPPKLSAILDFLQIPYESGELHIAGFDAHYTLRALLIIAADCANTPKLKEVCPPDFDWSSIQLALVSIGGGSSARGINAEPWRPEEVTTEVHKRLSRKANRPLFSLRPSSVKTPSNTREDPRLVRRLVRAVKKAIRSNDQEGHHPASGHDDIVAAVKETLAESNTRSAGSPLLGTEGVMGKEAAVPHESGKQKGKLPSMQGTWDSGYDDEAGKGRSSSTELPDQPRTVWPRQSHEWQPTWASQLHRRIEPLPGQSNPCPPNSPRPGNPYPLLGKGPEAPDATVSVLRGGPGILPLTTVPSDNAPVPAASRPTLQVPAGEGHSRFTGVGNESKEMPGFPFVGPAESQRKDPYAAPTTLAPSLPLPPVIGADYKAPQQQRRPRVGDLPKGCPDGVLTHGFHEQGREFLDDADCHADLVQTTDPVDRQEDLSVVPGNIQLVPAGPHMSSLNGLMNVKPQSPAKKLKRRAKGYQGPDARSQGPVSQDPEPQVSKVERLRRAVKDALPALPAVNKLRRSHKMLLRAMRKFEAADKTGAEEIQSLVELDTPDGQTGEPGTLAAPRGVLSSVSNASGSQARGMRTHSSRGRPPSSTLTTSQLDEALDTILEAPVPRTTDEIVEGEAKL